MDTGTLKFALHKMAGLRSLLDCRICEEKDFYGCEVAKNDWCTASRFSFSLRSSVPVTSDRFVFITIA